MPVVGVRGGVRGGVDGDRQRHILAILKVLKIKIVNSKLDIDF